jgi:hypothetical protein
MRSQSSHSPKNGSTAPTTKVSRILLGFSLACLGAGVALGPTAKPARGELAATRDPLPPPVVNPRSTEICMNSRISYHGGWNGTATDQMLADVLYAASRTPVTGSPLVIYAATPQNVYIYDPANHALVLHKVGNQRSDNTAAFEVGIAAQNNVDAGAAMHLAQLESIALWTGTAGQLASCPRASATTYANSHWDPANPIDIAISFGMRSVPGFTSDLVAISSDGSLPNPHTDGTIFFDDVLPGLAYDTTFATPTLSPAELSQILWASYGCSDHTASGKAGLVCSSAVANYYLTRRIYTVDAAGVYRYHNRLPPTDDPTTRDHRIELVLAGDVRDALRAQVAGLPEAPDHLVLCAGQTGAWPELEVGFAAIGAVAEAATLGLHGHVKTQLSTAEQTAIRQVTGIPSGDIPIALVSLGQASDPAGAIEAGGPIDRPKLAIEGGLTRDGTATIRYTLPAGAPVDLNIYDCLGRRIRSLANGWQDQGSHAIVWDCRDDRGQAVTSGVYFCRVKAGGRQTIGQVAVVK